MTVPAQDPVTTHTGNGVTTTFAYDFLLLDDDDLEVYVDGTAKSLGSDYTITGLDTPAGGEVIFSVAPPSAATVLFQRSVALERTTDYQYAGDFESPTVNRDFDRLMMAHQDTRLIAGRSIRLPLGEGVIEPLPSVANRALRALGFDNLGNPVAIAGAGDASLLALQLADQNTDSTGAALVGFDAARSYAAGTTGAAIKLRPTSADIASTSDATKGAALMGYKLNATGSVGRTLASKLLERISVKDFGAVGDGSTDDTTAIQGAINAIASSSVPLTLYFPRGTYRITSRLNTPSGAVVHLEGDGPGSTIIRQDSTTAGAIRFDCNFAQAGSVRAMTIKANSATATGSTGVGLEIDRCNDNFSVERVDISNFATSCYATGCFNFWISQVRLLYFQSYGLRIGASVTSTGAGLQLSKAKISNFGFTGTNTASIGILSEASGGDFFQDVDVTSSNQGIVLRPVSGKDVLYNFFTNVLADTCIGDGWTLDSTNGKVWSIHATNCWAAYSTSGKGLSITGVAANSKNIHFVNSRFRENGQQGIYLGVGGVRFSSCSVAANSKSSANSFDGVFVDANVSDWSFQDCIIGNYASTLPGHANNIFVQSGTGGNFQITGCDLRFPGSGKVPISLGTSALTYQIRNNLPIQSAGTNKSSITAYTAVSNGTVAAGTTRYLTPAGSTANVGDAPFVAPKPGVVSQVIAQVAAAPGAAQTFTYTMYLNGSATSMTGAISGAASFQVAITANPFSVQPGDSIVLQVVASGGAAVTTHRASVQIED